VAKHAFVVCDADVIVDLDDAKGSIGANVAQLSSGVQVIDVTEVNH
jgi:hypothetical protein